MKEYLNAIAIYHRLFEGRASRRSYVHFVVFCLLIAIGFAVLDYLLGLTNEVGGALSSIYWLFIFTPAIGMGVRRLHDLGHSGWALLIALVPIAGLVLVVGMLAQKGEPTANRFGSPPSAVETASTPTGSTAWSTA